MDLQKYIVKGVGNYGGLEKYQTDLAALAPFFGSNNIYHLNEMKVLFNLLHQMKIDLRDIAINNEIRILAALKIFKEIEKKTGLEIARLNIDIIENHIMMVPIHCLKVV